MRSIIVRKINVFIMIVCKNPEFFMELTSSLLSYKRNESLLVEAIH